MADENNQPAAESSTAAEPSTLTAPTNGAEYANWRMTGKLPEAKAPAPKAPKPGAPAASTDSAAGSEPDNSQGHRKGGAETRLNELLADLKRAGLSPAELKTFKREAQQQQSQQQQQPGDKAPAAKPEQTANPPAGLKPPEEPDPAKYKTYEELEAAQRKYARDFAEYTAKKAVEDYKAEQRNAAVQGELKKQLDAAGKRYGKDISSEIRETSSAIFHDQAVPAAVKALINDSPVLVDLLYVMGSKPEDLAAFIALSKSNPGQAIRKAVLMERLVSEELQKSSASGSESGQAGARDASGKFTGTPEKDKGSQAPPPPREVSGRGAAPPDAVATSAKRGDFAAYRAAQNAKEIARRKGH